MVIGTECTGSFKSIYYTIMILTAPFSNGKKYRFNVTKSDLLSEKNDTSIERSLKHISI
jgi:hypothetical protein